MAIGKRKRTEPKKIVLESIPSKDLNPMAPKQTLNFELNLRHGEVRYSTVSHLPIGLNAIKTARVKKEAEPDNLCTSVLNFTPLHSQKPHSHQELSLDFHGGTSCLVLTGCQNYHMYIMTFPDNDKCPSCQVRTLKEIWKLKWEAAERDAAKKLNKTYLCP